jgi:tetratricopeptide (TPR) repeat protein
MRSPNSACTRICVATLLAVTFVALPFQAGAQASSPLTDARMLLQKGQQGQALEKVDRYLTDNPKDRQARLLKGVILADMNKLDEAISVFVKLSEDAPELPEPYNNLAVIYTQQKQFDKAKNALEQALRTNPSYAVAHENLGDLYAKMAKQAYDKALQIDASPSDAAASSRLSLLREISGGPSRPVLAAAKPVPVISPVAAVAAPPVAAKPVAQPITSKPPIVAIALAQTPVAPPPKSEQPIAKPAPDEAKAAVRAVVLAWASAWSNKNTKEYLSYYGKDFQVPDRKARKAWEEERTQRVGKPGNIKVTLTDMDIKVAGEHASARFKQHYDSANFDSESGKTLDLILSNGHWQILQERIVR